LRDLEFLQYLSAESCKFIRSVSGHPYPHIRSTPQFGSINKVKAFPRDIDMANPLELTVSGDDPAARADALSRAAAASNGSVNTDLSDPRHKIRLRVIITGAAAPESFRNAVAYALEEIKAGIGDAGGSLSDGTHVEIRWLR